MKAIKLDLKDYEVQVGEKPAPTEGEPFRTEPIMKPYGLREQLAALILSRNRGLNGLELLKAEVVAKKILEAEGDDVLLSVENMAQIKGAADRFKGFGREEVELLHRIYDAPEVEVDEKDGKE